MESRRTYNPKHILCPVDMSPLSDLALKYADLGAHMFGAKLTVLHAMPTDYPRYLSKDLTQRLLNELAHAKSGVQKQVAVHVREVLGEAVEQLPVNYKVTDMVPAQAILQTADQEKADLIVMGTHGLDGLKHWVLGSVAEKVMHLSKVPIFTVRQKIDGFIHTDQPESRPQIEHILCPCNLSASAAEALHIAASLAERLGARLSVLFSVENGASGEVDRLDAWVRGTLQTRSAVELIVKKGDASDQIIATAQARQTDLIVIGLCHRPMASGTVVGRTSERVARYAPAPVLAVPYFVESV